MKDNSFYEGVLFELNKISGDTPGTQPGPTNIAKPQNVSAHPEPPPASPSPSGMMQRANNFMHTTLPNLAGKGLGMAAHHAPNMLGIHSSINKLTEGQIDKAVNNYNPLTPGKDVQRGVTSFGRGFLQENPEATSYLNKQIGNKTYGISSYNPESNKIQQDFSNFQGSKFLGDIGNWIKGHPGITAMGGGLLLLPLLLSAFRNKQQPVVNNYYSGAAPQQGSGPQFY